MPSRDVDSGLEQKSVGFEAELGVLLRIRGPRGEACFHVHAGEDSRGPHSCPGCPVPAVPSRTAQAVQGLGRSHVA